MSGLVKNIILFARIYEIDFIDIFIDALIDSAKMLPFLFAAFLLMEYFEHKAGDKLINALSKTGKGGIGGSFAGSLLGCVPQCGFSVAAANLYAGGMITTGTLTAVFLSTSDEAIPVLLAHPESAGLIWKLIATKIIIAFIAGVLIDAGAKVFKFISKEKPIRDLCSECGCETHGIWYSSLKHTINIFIFIFIINLILGMIMAYFGEETVVKFLGNMGIFQPVFAGLAGMIPNCAASVIITELLVNGSISFGSAVAGLCTGAGIGILVLYKSNKSIKENLIITGLIYGFGVLAGMLLDLFA